MGSMCSRHSHRAGRMEGLFVIQRARKGTGFDYWLKRPESTEPLFQDSTRLEVSEIRTGDETAIKARAKK